MAIAIVNAVWKNGPKDKNARYLLVAIGGYANDSGEAFPGLETLVNETRMSRSTVIRAMKSLVSEGWMTVRERRLARKTYATGNLYCLSLVKLRVGCVSAPKVAANIAAPSKTYITPISPQPRQLSPTETVVGVRVTPTAPRQQDTRRCQNGPSVGVRVTPEPSLEPKNPPLSPQGGTDPDLLAWGSDALKREIAELSAKKKILTPRSPEYFPLGARLITLRHALEQFEPPPPPPQPDAPMGFQTRRQRRLTQSQMLARVGGEGSCTYSREAQIEASSLVRRLAMQYEAQA